jgi:type IV pilus assembly protein PilC
MIYQSIFVWEAVTIEGSYVHGIAQNILKYQLKKDLSQKGLFQIKIQYMPVALSKKPLKSDTLIRFIQELHQIHTSGVTLINSLNIMIGNRQIPVIKYILVALKLSLEKGESLTKSFQNLRPVFNEFFISMINMSEKTDNLKQGFSAILSFFQQRQKQYQAIQKQTRYPLIVLGIAFILITGMIVFVLPMFQNIYLLYGQNLPVETAILMSISRFINNQWFVILAGIVVFVFWYKIPAFCYIHPLFLLMKWVKKRWFGSQDQLLFAHCMSLLLKSGKTAYAALQDISYMVSPQNRKQILKLTKQLEAGERFSEIFLKNKWFPSVFHRLISVSEAAGDLSVGFLQVHQYLENQMEKRFNKIINYIEPGLMVLLGGMVLFVLLSIYLPIFDLGNQVF